MISVEEFIEDSVVPFQGGGKPTANIVIQVVPSQAGGNPLREKSSSSAGGNLMAGENVHLRQELGAVRFQLGETKITAENYAQHVLAKSHLKAEEALSYQKDAFEKRAKQNPSQRAIFVRAKSRTLTLNWNRTRHQSFMSRASS